MILFNTDLVQASKNMRQADDRVSILVHLVEHVVAEELDDISVSRFRPTWLSGKPKAQIEQPII